MARLLDEMAAGQRGTDPEPPRIGYQVAQYLLQEARIDEQQFDELSTRDDGSASDLLRNLLAQDLLEPAELTVLLGAIDEAETRSGESAKPAAAGAAPTLRRYQVTDDLGAGGMGRVVRGFDRLLGRPVAIKVIRGDPGEREIRRFVREARVTGGLSHPSIVVVHDFGVSEDGQPYFTMKEVSGRTLKEARGQTLEPRDLPGVLDTFLKVCDAIGYAHSRGVIHRDLKPANVMVGEFGEVQVVDWGLAVKSDIPDEPGSAGGAAPDGDCMTTCEWAAGTLPFMAPEQARGEPVDAQADVFSLGAMLYWLLAGMLPYTATSRAAMLEQVIAGDWVPLSERLPGVELPWELEQIIGRAMAADKAARYPDVPSLRDDIAAWMSGRPVGAVAYSTAQILRLWARRNRLLVGALGAVCGLVVLGGAASVVFGMMAASSAERARVVAAEQRLAEQAASEGAAEAAGRLRAANRRAEDFRSLADQARIPRLLAEAGVHGPQSWKVKGMRDWRTRARQVLDRSVRHASLLAGLRQAGTQRALTSQERWHLGALKELLDRVGALRQAAARTERALAQAYRWRGQLQRSAELWARTREAIRADARYRGLDLLPQEGLHPLGKDPASGMWEFAHIPSGRAPRRDARGRLQLDRHSAIVLVLLPGGAFRTGGADPRDPYASRASPGGRHIVEPLFISKTEVTEAQKIRLARAMGLTPKVIKAKFLMYPARFGKQEAITMLAWGGLGLPTEIQWEYAARGGTTTPWWTGPDPRALQGAANLRDRATLMGDRLRKRVRGKYLPWSDGYPGDAPVARFRPNPFGLHDVLGNHEELCLNSWPAVVPLNFQGRSTEADLSVLMRGGTALSTPFLATAYVRSWHSGASGVRPVREVRR